MIRKKDVKSSENLFALYLPVWWKDFVPNQALIRRGAARQSFIPARRCPGAAQPLWALPSHSHVWLQKGFAETSKPPSSQRGNFLLPWALWALDPQGSTWLLNSEVLYSSLSAVCSVCQLLWTNAERAQNGCWVMMTLINYWVFC